MDLALEKIAKALFLDDQTLKNWWKEYKEEGLANLLKLKSKTGLANSCRKNIKS